MSVNNSICDQIFIGIDGGGSKCRATIMTSDSKVIGTGLGGPANPLHGYERTLQSIQDSTEQAFLDAGLEVSDIANTVAGLGLAGVNLPGLYQKMLDWSHPFKKMFLTTDLHTACIGAHQGNDGAVIVTGTGSCGFSHVNGVSKLIGGHGFAHGDKGSGAWMGLEAVKHVLMAMDGLAQSTAMTESMKEQLQVSTAMEIAEKMAGQPSSAYAKLASVALLNADKDDEVAIAIVRDGASYISDLARKLLEDQPPALSMIGGLAEPLHKWLDKEVADIVNPPKQPPEIGAVFFAQKEFAQQDSALR